MTDESIGCGDNSCVFSVLRQRGGMGTNGGCRCFENLVGHLSLTDGSTRSNRDEVQKVARDTRRLAQEVHRLRAEVGRLRNALASISLDEYESTSSASEKVHGHARIARKALYEKKP